MTTPSRPLPARTSRPHAFPTLQIALAVSLGWMSTRLSDILVFDYSKELGLRNLFFVTALLTAIVAALVIRIMKESPPDRLLATVYLSGYVVWLLAGVTSWLGLAFLREHGWPIARFATLPPEHALMTVLVWSTLGGLALALGISTSPNPAMLMRRRFLGGRMPLLHVTQSELARVGRSATLLLSLGLTASAVLVAHSRGVAILSTEVDAIRFTQGESLGMVTLLQYFLPLSAVMLLCTAIAARQHRGLYIGLASVAMSTFVLTRAERTGFLVVALSLVFFARTLGLRLSRRGLLIIVSCTLLAFISVGGIRFISEYSDTTWEAAPARVLYDLAPEVREQGFVLSLYGQEIPHTGMDGGRQLAVSVVSGRFLGLFGVDKSEVYGDSSRTFVTAMRKLGIYQIDKPLRVGIGGELWMMGGASLLLAGMAVLGFIVGALSKWRPQNLVETVSKAYSSALLILALITPLGALMPIALVSLIPLTVLIVRSATATRDAYVTVPCDA